MHHMHCGVVFSHLWPQCVHIMLSRIVQSDLLEHGMHCVWHRKLLGVFWGLLGLRLSTVSSWQILNFGRERLMHLVLGR